MSGPASLLLSRVLYVSSTNIQKHAIIRQAGPDMSSYPPPTVAQIFGFFVFFCFLDGFAMLLGRGLWFF